MQKFTKGLVQITDLLENPLCIMYYGGGGVLPKKFLEPPPWNHPPLYKGGWC